MTEPLFLTRETWGSTYSNWDHMIAYKALAASYGFEISKWRMHPANLDSMIAEASPGWISIEWGSQPFFARVLGAPLILDSTQEENRVSVLLRVEHLTIMPTSPEHERIRSEERRRV